MAKPKVYIYIPADASGESHKRLEAEGCELSFGDATWRAKRGATVETFHKNAGKPQALLGARKNTHLWGPVAWGAPVAKSSIDGERESVLDEELYDELLTVAPPLRIMGGVQVKF